MIRPTLLSDRVTLGQGLILGAWYTNLLIVFALWASTSFDLLLHGGPGGFFVATGRLFGLLAVIFALTQFLLMGRILWIERRFGLDRMAAYHRLNGYMAICLIIVHPPLIALGYALQSHSPYVKQYLNIISQYSYALWALIGEVLFVLVVFTSIYIVRKHLKFERWYAVHLMVYAAIILSFFHQFALGGSLSGHPLNRAYWYAVYGFVALNVLIWRFALPTLNLLRFGFRVVRVEAETPSTTSLYIKGRNLQKWRALPGQFVLVRILNRQFGLQEHPFSLSAVPNDDEFRLTIRKSGDYTSDIAKLKPGAPVLVSGPFGRFTNDIAVTNKRLFIAGGVGITPTRSLAVEAAANKLDSVLIHANRNIDDVPLKAELEALQRHGDLKLQYVYSDGPAPMGAESGRLTGDLIARLVPDWKQRDVYLCGPPPMMTAIVDDLTKRGVDVARLHFERFELHA